MLLDETQFEEIGFIKYSGADLTAGIIDAGIAGSALVGLDEAMRFFNVQQSRDFAGLHYDVPVLTRAGSWEAVLLASSAVGGAFALGYAKKAGEKIAENDFKDFSLKPVLAKSIAAIQVLAGLIKHTKAQRGWESVRIEPTMGIDSVFVQNEYGEEMQIPMEFYRWYQKMPPRLLVKMTSVIRKGRVLTIGTVRNGKVTSTSINSDEKFLFDINELEDADEENLFPELVHGSAAVLEGRLIRGNEASNSVGLEYMGHVINCVPSAGSVRQYKAALFLQCRVEGRVTRLTKNRFIADRRPTIVINTVVPLESDKQAMLFD